MKRLIKLACIVSAMVFCTSGLMATELSREALSRLTASINSIVSEKANLSRVDRKIDSAFIATGRLGSVANQVANQTDRKWMKSLNSMAGELFECEISCVVTDKLLESVVSCGGRILSKSVRYNSIHALLSLEGMRELAADSDVRRISRVFPSVHNKVYTSQGDVAHRANYARQQYGVTGKGISVGVISDSARYLETMQKSGDLPSDVVVLSGYTGVKYNSKGNRTDTGEGAGMMEIVYDLAPDAKLYFATSAPLDGDITWNESVAEMADSIDALAAKGCKIIVDDIGKFGESAFQDSAIVDAINRFTDAGGLYFSSASNSGNLDSGNSGTWEGDFNDSKNSWEYTVDEVPKSTTYHLFSSSVSYNALTTAGTAVILQWSDPWGRSSNDYDLFLTDSSGKPVAYSVGTQDGYGDPFEIAFVPDAYVGKKSPGLYVVVVKASSAKGRYLRVDTCRGRLKYGTAGSTYGHSAAARTFSIAAAAAPNRTFSSSDPVETYSSDGPRRVFFDYAGNAYKSDYSSTGGKLLQKPDFTAADQTYSYWSKLYYNDFYGEDNNMFSGTSAAAPHAAAIAALMLEANPKLTRDQIFEVLKQSTISPSSNWNRNYGYGMIDAYVAVQKAKEYSSSTPTPTPTPTPVTCTITFDPNGGTGGKVVRTRQSGNSIGELPVTSWSPHTFIGWFTQRSGGSQIYSYTTVTGDAIYYAHWQKKQYQITFIANGGNVSETSRMVDYCATYGTLPTPTWTGHDFLGWFTDKTAGTQVTADTKCTGNKTVYAHWKIKQYTLTFRAEGGSVSPAYKMVNYCATYNGPLPTPTWGGHEFLGWYTAKTGGTLFELPWKCVGNKIIHAQWKVKQYKLTFDANGGALFGSVSSMYMMANYYTAWGTLPTPTRSGYDFVGWYTAKNDGTKVTDTTKCIGNLTVYARWKLKQYKITFDANGGNVSPASKTVNYCSLWGTLPTPTPSTGFLGWFTSRTGGTKVTASTKCTGNLTVYAHWDSSVKKYTIKFNANGGSVSPTSRTLNYCATYGTLPVPTWNPHEFIGWYTAKSGGTQVTSSTICVGNATVYARWKMKQYSITFNANGGKLFGSTSPVSMMVTYCAAYGTLPTPERGGYDFVGWFTARTDGKQVTATTKCIGVLTVYARWRIKQYMLTFNANGGNVSPTFKMADYCATWGSLPTPTWGGRAFAGWYTDKTGGTRVTDMTKCVGNRTVYAHWLSFTVGGDVRWTVQSDGRWMVGGLANGQSAWIETTVSGPGTFVFNWATEGYWYNRLTFYIDGVEQEAINGSRSSSTRTYTVTGAGSHKLRWTYSFSYYFDSTVSNYAWLNDCIWQQQ